MLAVAHLVVAVLVAVHVLAGLIRPRRPRFGSGLRPVAGVLASELTRFVAVALLVVTAGFAALGTADEGAGRVALVLAAGSLAGLAVLEWWGHRARRVVAAATADLPAVARPARPPGAWRPLAFTSEQVVRDLDVAYGEHRRQRLDVWRPRAASGAPVLVQVHGGAWVGGSRRTQARPLLRYLAELGWVCVTVDYRLAPGDGRWPVQLEDVKRALAWVRANVADHGGDPSWVAVTGGSAGGHLAALAALTGGRTELQPGFEDADTTVQAAVPVSGVFDLADRFGFRAGRGLRPFLERRVMPATLAADPAGWDAASPLALVHRQAPPMLVVHGTHDALAPVEEARAFVTALRAVSAAEVRYLELPHAQHSFDMVRSPRTLAVVEGVARFLTGARERDLRRLATCTPSS